MVATKRGALALVIAQAAAGCTAEPVDHGPLDSTTIVASSAAASNSSASTAASAGPLVAMPFRSTRELVSDPALAERVEQTSNGRGLQKLLDELAEPARTELAIALSKHESVGMRRSAAYHVTRHAPGRVRELAPLLEDTTPIERGCFGSSDNVAETLVQDLARLEDASAEQFVLEIAHRRTRVGAIALRDSKLAGTPEWRAILLERLADDDLPSDQLVPLVDAFVRAPSPDLCPLLQRWLSSEDLGVRHRVVRELGRCDEPASLDALLSLPSRDSSHVADWARATAILSPTLAPADRAKLLTNPSLALRSALAEVLQSRLRDASTAKEALALVPVIVAAMPEPEGDSEPSFGGALIAATPSPEATELMRALVEKAPAHRYDVISGALGYLVAQRDAASLRLFRIALDSPDRRVVQQGLFGVSLLHDKPSRAKVERLATSTKQHRLVVELARSTLDLL